MKCDTCAVKKCNWKDTAEKYDDDFLRGIIENRCFIHKKDVKRGIRIES